MPTDEGDLDADHLSAELIAQLVALRRVQQTKPVAEYRAYLKTHPEAARLFGRLTLRIAKSLAEQVQRVWPEVGHAILQESPRWPQLAPFTSDLALVLWEDSFTSSAERWEAALRLAQEISPWFRDPRAAQVIRKKKRACRAEQTRKWILNEILPDAVMLVVQNANLAQPGEIRLGRRWVNGRQPMAPELLDEEQLIPWWKQEVKNAAEAILLGETYRPTDAYPVLKRTKPLSKRAKALLKCAETVASRRQRALLKHLQAGVSHREAAKLLDLKPGTVRVMLHHLKKKIASKKKSASKT
jgi:hypothetical protein